MGSTGFGCQILTGANRMGGRGRGLYGSRDSSGGGPPGGPPLWPDLPLGSGVEGGDCGGSPRGGDDEGRRLAAS